MLEKIKETIFKIINVSKEYISNFDFEEFRVSTVETFNNIVKTIRDKINR